jgi:hypothetical protein
LYFCAYWKTKFAGYLVAMAFVFFFWFVCLCTSLSMCVGGGGGGGGGFYFLKKNFFFSIEENLKKIFLILKGTKGREY